LRAFVWVALLCAACASTSDPNPVGYTGARTLLNSAESSLAGLTAALAWTAYEQDACVSVSGDVSDPDADGVPANTTLTLDCEREHPAADMESITGTITVTDPAGEPAGSTSLSPRRNARHAAHRSPR